MKTKKRLLFSKKNKINDANILRPTKEDYLIQCIKSNTITNRWINGKAGQFKDFDNNCLYRFCETNENLGAYLLKEHEQKILPIVACGFVAWLIKHWGANTQYIYSGYLQARLIQYKNEHICDPNVWERDLECEFHEQFRDREEQYIKHSEAIFGFISKQEVNKIKNYVSYFFDSIQYINK